MNDADPDKAFIPEIAALDRCDRTDPVNARTSRLRRNIPAESLTCSTGYIAEPLLRTSLPFCNRGRGVTCLLDATLVLPPVAA